MAAISLFAVGGCWAMREIPQLEWPQVYH